MLRTGLLKSAPRILRQLTRNSCRQIHHATEPTPKPSNAMDSLNVAAVLEKAVDGDLEGIRTSALVVSLCKSIDDHSTHSKIIDELLNRTLTVPEVTRIAKSFSRQASEVDCECKSQFMKLSKEMVGQLSSSRLAHLLRSLNAVDESEKDHDFMFKVSKTMISRIRFHADKIESTPLQKSLTTLFWALDRNLNLETSLLSELEEVLDLQSEIIRESIRFMPFVDALNTIECGFNSKTGRILCGFLEPMVEKLEIKQLNALVHILASRGCDSNYLFESIAHRVSSFKSVPQQCVVELLVNYSKLNRWDPVLIPHLCNISLKHNQKYSTNSLLCIATILCRAPVKLVPIDSLYSFAQEIASNRIFAMPAMSLHQILRIARVFVDRNIICGSFNTKARQVITISEIPKSLETEAEELLVLLQQKSAFTQTK